MLRTTQVAAAASSVTSSVTYTGALVGMNGATTAATAGMHGFRLASIAAFITNPVGLAIIGISTVVLLLVTHFDQLVAAAKAVADFFTGIFSPAAKTARDSLDSLRASVSETITITDSLQISVKRAGDETATQTGRMAGSWQKLTSDLEVEVIKQETLYKRIANPIGPDLRVPVAAANPFAGMAVPAPGSTITPPAGWSSSGAPLGTLAGNTGYLNSLASGTVKKKALGGEGMVFQPTLFLAGENGPEGFKFTPGRATGEDRTPVHIHFEINGREIAHAIVDDINNINQWRNRLVVHSRTHTIHSQ
jgi:hypothetical protein